MQIFVKPLNMINLKIFILDVDLSCTIKKLKEQILNKLNIHKCHINLQFECKILNDVMTLEYYNITRESVLGLRISETKHE